MTLAPPGVRAARSRATTAAVRRPVTTTASTSVDATAAGATDWADPCPAHPRTSAEAKQNPADLMNSKDGAGAAGEKRDMTDSFDAPLFIATTSHLHLRRFHIRGRPGSCAGASPAAA